MVPSSIVKQYENDAFQGADMYLQQESTGLFSIMFSKDDGQTYSRHAMNSVADADAFAAKKWDELGERTCCECGHEFDPSEPGCKPVDGDELGVCSECNITEEKIEEKLIELVEEDCVDFGMSKSSARSFEDDGVMSNNRGVVLKVGKKKFQLTIVEC